MVLNNKVLDELQHAANNYLKKNINIDNLVYWM